MDTTESIKVSDAVSSESEDLPTRAQRHLIMHFTGASSYREQPPQVFVSGEGCWLTDTYENQYLDALAGLFCVNVGYSHGEEIGDAVKTQMMQLPYSTNWGRAHPPAIALAAKIADLTPASLDHVFFTSGGSESNEAAVKLIRQYHQSRGESARTKFIARGTAYHGTTYAALSLNGMTALRTSFEPLMHGTLHVSNTKRYKRPTEETERAFTSLLLHELEATIVQEGPETIAGIFVEPLQNAGGSLTPPAGYVDGIREICNRYGILLVADEVICGFGRLGEWFGCQRYGLHPDVITFAKGVSSAYAPIGGMITTSEILNTVLDGPQGMYLHGVTFGGHPAACAAALSNIAIMEREDLLGHVRGTESYLRSRLSTLLDHPLVGDLRGDGFHYSLELVTDKKNRSWRADVSANEFLNSHLAPALINSGILCRAAVDHENTLLIQFSPPLVLSEAEIDPLVERARMALDEVLPMVNY